MSKNLKRRVNDEHRRALQSRSRSVTPGPQVDELNEPATIMSNLGEERDPYVEPLPKLWIPTLITGHNVERTLGGSVELEKTGDSIIRYKTVLEESIHNSALERAAALDLDEGEGITALEEHSDHLRKWVNELAPLECFEPIPRPFNTPVPEGDLDLDLVAASNGISGTCQTSKLSAEHVEVSPSTSDMTPSFQRHAARSVADGSELDSDYDDEFDVEVLANEGRMDRDIPDDNELDEQLQTMINSLEQAMDNAIEQLVSVSTDFNWTEDFSTFRAVPEVFSGPTPGPIKNYDMPYDAFVDIWDKDIMKHIVRETNRYAKQVIDNKTTARTLKPSSCLNRWRETDVDEMYVYFAICISMGISELTSEHEYWATSGIIQFPQFRKLMPYNRFILLNKFLHFADNFGIQNQNGRQRPNSSAKLSKLGPVLDHLNSKFSNLYNLEKDIAIDESLTLFKGRLSWTQTIRSKANRFGIKSYELCEPRTGFLWAFEIYTVKNSERDNVVAPSVDFADKSSQAVVALLKRLERRGHCLAMTNFCNCPALVRYLKSLGFDCLGSLRENRKNVPEVVANLSQTAKKGTVIASHSGDVSCIAWKDRKVVRLISTYHDAKVYVGRKAGREIVKPLVVKDYDNIMGALELNDQKLSMYLVERKECVKWYIKIFKRLLNVSVHNAFVMLLGSLNRRNMPLITHRDFCYHLVDLMAEKHRAIAPQKVFSPIEETRLRRDIVHVPAHLKNKSRMYCHMCLRKGNKKKVKFFCSTCEKGMCLETCWVDWHSLQQLPGKCFIRKKARRQH